MGMSLSAKIVYGILVHQEDSNEGESVRKARRALLDEFDDDWDNVVKAATADVDPEPKWTDDNRTPWVDWYKARVQTHRAGVDGYMDIVVGVPLANCDYSPVAVDLTKAVTATQAAALDAFAAFLTERGIPAKVDTYLLATYW